MGDKSQFMTVKEFANEVNLSSQAIYNQLTRGLKEYVAKIDGKTMINRKALELYKAEREENAKANSLVLEILKQQLEEKDKQIEHLQQLLAISQQNQQLLLEQTAPVTQTMAAEQETAADQEQTKKGFWSRIFK